MKWGIMLITRCFNIHISETSISKAILQPCHLVLEDVHKPLVIKSLQIHTFAHTFFLLEFRSLNKMLELTLVCLLGVVGLVFVTAHKSKMMQWNNNKAL